jgi:amino acid efflux transporter
MRPRTTPARKAGAAVENRKTLRLPQIIALYIGAVLGSGVLILPGVAAELAGPASLLAWGSMAVLVMPMSLTIGLLSARYPNQGGVAYFVSIAFSRRLGSLVGWCFSMAVIVGAPVLALTGAGYFCSALGVGGLGRLLVAIGILAVGVAVNYRGIRLTGQVQIAVVLTILILLVMTIGGSIPKIDRANFVPFMPHSPWSVGYVVTTLFWCFIGWEAVSSMADSFERPRRDAIRGTIAAALIVGIMYFLTAFGVVGTRSYGAALTEAPLIRVISLSYGKIGIVMAGIAALFICIAPAIVYIGAIARIIQSLAQYGFAPRLLARASKRRGTPIGGLGFLAICFAVLLLAFSSGVVSLKSLVQMPSAAFILTYLGACAAGAKLLKDSRIERFMSLVSFTLAAIALILSRQSLLYPLSITAVWALYVFRRRKEKRAS